MNYFVARVINADNRMAVSKKHKTIADAKATRDAMSTNCPNKETKYVVMSLSGRTARIGEILRLPKKNGTE